MLHNNVHNEFQLTPKRLLFARPQPKRICLRRYRVKQAETPPDKWISSPLLWPLLLHPTYDTAVLKLRFLRRPNVHLSTLAHTSPVGAPPEGRSLWPAGAWPAAVAVASDVAASRYR